MRGGRHSSERQPTLWAPRGAGQSAAWRGSHADSVEVVGVTVGTVLVAGCAVGIGRCGVGPALRCCRALRPSGEGIDAEVSWNEQRRRPSSPAGRDGPERLGQRAGHHGLRGPGHRQDVRKHLENIRTVTSRATDNGDGTLTITIAQPGRNSGSTARDGCPSSPVSNFLVQYHWSTTAAPRPILRCTTEEM